MRERRDCEVVRPQYRPQVAEVHLREEVGELVSRESDEFCRLVGGQRVFAIVAEVCGRWAGTVSRWVDGPLALALQLVCY